MIQAIDKGTIRLLMPDEVSRVIPLALEFQRSSQLFDPKRVEERWEEVWSITIETGTGGIIAYEVDEKIVGVLCFLVGFSPLDGVMQMTESMWYVQKAHRGDGMILLGAAEDLARSMGCERFFMAHLADTKADRLEKVFKRRGFRPTETYYLKDL